MNRLATLALYILVATVFAVTCPVPTAQAVPFTAGNGWSEIVSAAPPTQLPNGNWEYVYDLIGGTSSWSRFVTFSGFDADGIANLHTGQYGDENAMAAFENPDGSITGVWQRWDGHTVRGYPPWGGFQERSIYPSYWNAGSQQWDLANAGMGGNWPGQNEAWAIDNTWHTGNEYVLGNVFGQPAANFRRYPGVLIDSDGQPGNDGLQFDSFTHVQSGWGHNQPGLQATFRIEHPAAPGQIVWSTYHNDTPGGLATVEGTILGPAAVVPEPSLPSDLTNNGFVDFEDLTILLANWNRRTTPARGNLVNADTTPVNFEDLTVLLADWTGPGPAGSPEAALGTEAVPEPSTLLLALLATLGLSFYRRRRRRAL